VWRYNKQSCAAAAASTNLNFKTAFPPQSAPAGVRQGESIMEKIIRRSKNGKHETTDSIWEENGEISFIRQGTFDSSPNGAIEKKITEEQKSILLKGGKRAADLAEEIVYSD